MLDVRTIVTHGFTHEGGLIGIMSRPVVVRVCKSPFRNPAWFAICASGGTTHCEIEIRQPGVADGGSLRIAGPIACRINMDTVCVDQIVQTVGAHEGYRRVDANHVYICTFRQSTVCLLIVSQPRALDGRVRLRGRARLDVAIRLPAILESAYARAPVL